MATKNDPNVFNGSRHLFDLLNRGMDFLTEEKELRMHTIMNNSSFLHQEQITMSLLSDSSLAKRRLGKKIILKAREQQPAIEGVRSFQKYEKIENANFWATDYSKFLHNLDKVFEPTFTMHLNEDQLDDVVSGSSSIIDLCDLQDVTCHTTVCYF